MKIVETAKDLRLEVRAWRHEGARVAFVPTMGNLHAGHLRLIAEAREHAPRVVVSIFVNPLQFGPGEDFERYPRTFEEDCERLRGAGADLLFCPGVDEMYPGGTASTTRIDVPELSGILCGASRPGHFSGVATVVAKLLNLAAPDVALFGEKDYQQLLVIKRMVADLCMPVQIVGMPTVREADGLAMSSRNQYLSESERAVAPALFRCLNEIAERLAQGERDYAGLESAASGALQRAGMRVDYVSIRNASDLMPPVPDARVLVVLAAAWLGRARLIDNLAVTLPCPE